MFERSLSSLIKGLRSHRGKDEARYVATLMDEIKYEVRSGDMDVKAEAVLKLTYLQMLGYAPSNASFHMLEVMASPRFHLKQLGYLAASQCFTPGTDVLILATNMIKKDLRSPNVHDITVALNGLSHIIAPDLAQHLAPDVITLLTHTRPAVRKRAILVLHSIILQYPPALEQAFGRLSEKLEDSDAGVISATVNILCELARRDATMAKAFVPLSPQLFHLLTNSTNNWMLIKIVKLFGVLTPLEPRLARRLVPPITTIISTTPAMSLLYECMHTVIIGGMLESAEGDQLAATCSDKLGIFLDDDDQNLRYIALLALVKILPTHPHLVAVHQDRIFDSMDDEDLSIRFRALDLVSGMASRKNFVDIVHQQLRYIDPVQQQSVSSNRGGISAVQALRQAMHSGGATADEPASLSATSSWISPSYRLEIINRILDLGSAETYTNIIDFEWYVDILVRLNYLAGNSVGRRVQWQLIDITSRVRAVRSHAIDKLKQVLEDTVFIEQHDTDEQPGHALDVLRAAAWVCGEYCQHVAYPPALISLLLRHETLQACDFTTQAMMVHNAIKLLAWWLLEQGKTWSVDKLGNIRSLTGEVADTLHGMIKATQEDAELSKRVTEFALLIEVLQTDLNKYAASGATESTERTESSSPSRQGEQDKNELNRSASQANSQQHSSPPKSLQLLSPLFFGHVLGPVAKKAQSKVSVPAGLDLHAWFVEPGSVHIVDVWEEEEAAQAKAIAGKSKRKEGSAKAQEGDRAPNTVAAKKTLELQEQRRLRAEREKRQRESPYYLGVKSKKGATATPNLLDEQDIDNIPIVQLQLDDNTATATTDAAERSTVSGASTSAAVIPQKEAEEMPDTPQDEGQALRKTVGKKKKRKPNTKGVSEETLQ